MAESNKENTMLMCHRGVFQFKIMLFGLANAPSVFQEVMTHMLQGINGVYAITYLDVIVIFSQNEAEHLINLCRY